MNMASSRFETKPIFPTITRVLWRFKMNNLLRDMALVMLVIYIWIR
jgi:hypothetical protein